MRMTRLHRCLIKLRLHMHTYLQPRSGAELLPALEKHGKTCQVLLGPVEVVLVQTTGDADGMHITVGLAKVRFWPVLRRWSSTPDCPC